MLCDVQVEECADHPLVLSVVPFGFLLEEVDTGLAQTDGDLDLFLIHEDRTVVHLGDGNDILRLGQTHARSGAGLAAHRREIAGHRRVCV